MKTLAALASTMLILCLGAGLTGARTLEQSHRVLMTFSSGFPGVKSPPPNILNFNSPPRANAVMPERAYNYQELKEALNGSPETNKDAEQALEMIPASILAKLDQMGVKVIYHSSYFDSKQNTKKCVMPGNYFPWNRQIHIHCKRSISVLLAETAHAVDQLVGGGHLLSARDPQFQSLHEKYKNAILAHLRAKGHKNLKEHLEKGHSVPWNYLPGPEDADPVLGPQGYDQIVELYMEGFIYHYYNPNKIAFHHPEILQYVRGSLETAERTVDIPAAPQAPADGGTPDADAMKGFSAGESPVNPVVERGPASTRGEPSGLVLGSGGKGDSPALNPCDAINDRL
ncbi:MAG: hypothetical protein HY401_01410 [Elusimicrobia bacterium]|nr:hypothetical protein [Elusimicrobiota bacterium]